MNQILVTEKVIVTKEMRKKKKFYKRNFFFSIFLVCVLFSYYVYAEYDRNKNEEKSHEILSNLNLEIESNINEDDETVMEPSAFIASNAVRIENDILKVFLNSTMNEEEIKLGNILKKARERVEEAENQEENANVQEEVEEIPTVQENSSTNSEITYKAEAILKIPRLGIEYPVLSETSEELLKVSVNKLWGFGPNVVGNYCIVGHNYKSGKMFGKLSNIKLGDQIELTDLSGKTIIYIVEKKYDIDPTDVSCTSQLTNGRREVTLITCSYSGTKRLVVQAFEQE